jgi:hypothetical protein
MHNEAFNDDIRFDRLVDGELSGAERRRFLESLDAQPEGWRRCALAFLEAQSWREELGQVAQSPPGAKTSILSATSDQPNRKTQWTTSLQWLAIAASLLLAFGLGWIQHEHPVPVAGPVSAPGGQIARTSQPPATAVPNGRKASDALTFYVRDDTGRMQRVRVPLVDASTLDKQLGVQFQSGLPDALRDQFKNRGYNVQSKRRYAPLWLENGNPMIVPVEDTKIVPVSDRTY